jgi:multiple sugar transport system substrate-binding protein
MTRELRLLNWGHRRATAPVAAAAAEFAAREPGAAIKLDVQPLSGFEHGLSERVVDSYDLVIFDHPFCGSIAADRLLLPLGPLIGDLRDTDFIGKSLTSYRYADKLWAVPIDGATQSAVYRPDLMPGDADLPRQFDDVLALGRKLRGAGQHLGVASLNPHGFLVAAALCASLGAPLSDDPLADPFDRRAMREALRLLKELAALARPDCLGMNAIDLHNAMSRDDDLVYCPAAYMYLTYAEDGFGKRLAYGPFPGVGGAGPGGTVLGGTGLGVTRSCRQIELAAAFARMFCDGESQKRLISLHHGQAGHVAGWDDAGIDRRYGGALSQTRTTIDGALVRPRYRSFISFQHGCGGIVERFLTAELTPEAAINAMVAEWRRATVETLAGT